jgi:hypothetical protein
MRKLIIPALMAAAAISGAAPASAQNWRIQPTVQRQIQSDIGQLNNQINRAQQKRVISQREATGLRREALSLQRLYNNYSRNGLDRAEVSRIEGQINRLRQGLRLERRDWDNRRG